MILKLFKYDFRGIGKRIVPIYIMALVMALVSRFVFVNKYILTDQIEYSNVVLDMISGIIFAASWMVIAAIYVVTFFMLISQYQKSVFGEEGYLTNTLPIKTEQIIIAKSLNYIFWNFIASLVAFFCVGIMFFNGDFWRELVLVMHELLAEITITKQVALSIGIYALVVLISPFVSSFMIFLCIGIGSQFKHKLVMGVVAYMGISTISSIIYNIIFSLTFFNYNYMEISDIQFLFKPQGALLILFTMLVLGAGYFYGTYYIQKNKLNLE